MGVEKTIKTTFFREIRYSKFIYTPTEKFKNCQENPYFLILYTNFIPISYPISSNPTKINTFTNLPSQFPTHNLNHFLHIQIQKSKENPHFYRLTTFHQKSYQSNQNLQHTHLYPIQHKIQHKYVLYKYSSYSKT